MDLKTISDEECRISKKVVLPKSRLKIRRFPSCKIHKVSTASCLPNTIVKHIQQQIQPLIIHTYDPKIIVTEPSNFKWVVQRLTGSSSTQSSLCKLKREMKKERQLQAHADQLKALASTTDPSNTSPNEVNSPLTPKSPSNITSSDYNTASTELKEGNSDMDDSVSPKSPSNLTSSEDNTASTELKEGSLDTDGTSFPCFEQDMAAEEYNFFSFSFDSYYANNSTANDMDPFSAESFVFPMALSPGDVLNLSSLKDLFSCLPTVDEVI